MPNNNVNLADYANEFIIAGGGVAAAVTAWTQGRKAVKGSELDNVHEAVTIWRETTNGLKERLADIEEQGEKCEREKIELQKKMKAIEDRQIRMAEAMASQFAAQGHKINPKINLDLL